MLNKMESLMEVLGLSCLAKNINPITIYKCKLAPIKALFSLEKGSPYIG